MKSKSILVLGGSGFVGSRFIREATKCGCKVVSLSRRGQPPGKSIEGVTWLAGDASDKSICDELVRKYGPFDACIHTVGLLLDIDSGLSILNQYASGSGSKPTSTSTYDMVTTQTAFTILDSLSLIQTSSDKKMPFIFISAAEAGWKFPAPVAWLERYLQAKRFVEARLISSTFVRPVIFRPSLIWTWERPQALFSVIPFIIGSSFLPFVDKPVMLETLVSAMVQSIANDTASGIYRCRDIEIMSTKQ